MPPKKKEFWRKQVRDNRPRIDAYLPNYSFKIVFEMRPPGSSEGKALSNRYLSFRSIRSIPDVLGQQNSSRTKSGKQKDSPTTPATLQSQFAHPNPPHTPYPKKFANPEILGEPLEAGFHNEDPENMRLDTHYAGVCEYGLEDEDCPDPDVIKEMVLEERATWLGKWFGHHYAAWVSEFDMKELETYESHFENILRDSVVGPLPSLMWTFYRFRVPEDEYRDPLFHSPVSMASLSQKSPSRPSSFG